jgi:hypothetical protein
MPDRTSLLVAMTVCDERNDGFETERERAKNFENGIGVGCPMSMTLKRPRLKKSVPCALAY